MSPKPSVASKILQNKLNTRIQRKIHTSFIDQKIATTENTAYEESSHLSHNSRSNLRETASFK